MIAVYIESKRKNKSYQLTAITEYVIDFDMEADANQFQISAAPASNLVGVFNKFDRIEIFLHGKGIMRGYIDDVTYNSNNTVTYVGRCIMSTFIDNDALPKTIKNVKPKTYIKDSMLKYRPELKFKITSRTISTQKEFTINPGDTELSVYQAMVEQDTMRIWAEYDTIHIGRPAYGAEPIAYFSRGIPAPNAGIPITNITFKDSGVNLASEYRIYTTSDGGKEKLVSTATNKFLVKEGVKKRSIVNADENMSQAKYNKYTLLSIREQFRNSMVLEFDFKTIKKLLMPDNTIVVTDNVLKFDGVFYIRGIEHRKNATDGSVTHVTCVPADHTFDMIWKLDAESGTDITSGESNRYILGTPDISLTELLSGRSKK